MKYHIITYGCQMNHSDSERIAVILKLAKISPTKNIKEAGLLIINSCSVRQSAINRIYGQLINFKSASPANSPKKREKKTILTGCILESDKKKFKDKFDLIIDIKELTNPKNQAVKKLIKLIKPSINEQEFKAFDYTDYFKINPQYRSNFSAYIPIMTGCNNFCSYCAVPYTRGREISRPANEIITEIERLIKKGYKEITLLGQNVNSYGNHRGTDAKAFMVTCGEKTRTSEVEPSAELTQKINFPQLLKMINAIPGNFWIRFLTSHPKDMSNELIETMARCKKVCEYIHLPIQAGDDNILEKMNRRYTSAQYLKLIKKIKLAYQKRNTAYSLCYPELVEGSLANARKNRTSVRDSSTPLRSAQNDKSLSLAISTDIIVGFPGETKTQFANTAKIMRSVKYDMAYLAQYSPRPGTAAAKLKDNVSIIEKKRRKEFLNNILRKTALANNKNYEGKIMEVLIEKIDGNVATGKTRTFKNVRIQNPPHSPLTKGEEKNEKKIPPFEKGRLGGISLQPGRFALIKITQANAWGLEGEVVK